MGALPLPPNQAFGRSIWGRMALVRVDVLGRNEMSNRSTRRTVRHRSWLRSFTILATGTLAAGFATAASAEEAATATTATAQPATAQPAGAPAAGDEDIVVTGIRAS